MKTGRKYGEKEKIQILIKSLIYRTLRIYIFSFYAFLFFVSFANRSKSLLFFSFSFVVTRKLYLLSYINLILI